MRRADEEARMGRWADEPERELERPEPRDVYEQEKAAQADRLAMYREAAREREDN